MTKAHIPPTEKSFQDRYGDGVTFSRNEIGEVSILSDATDVLMTPEMIRDLIGWLAHKEPEVWPSVTHKCDVGDDWCPKCGGNKVPDGKVRNHHWFKGEIAEAWKLAEQVGVTGKRLGLINPEVFNYRELVEDDANYL